ncbi:MAG TPA: type I-C CRISPR-associated endonuclease Cas1c, partial [Nitrolancea sp.]|nr:type I-C CRISPR-associated endonuclease Cas1c [Nitrolancea sp.]
MLNTLYVTTAGSYLHLDHDTVRVEVEHETALRVPLIHLGSIVCFGHVMLSPALLGRCAADGCSVVLLDQNGRFKARVEGPVKGNVLLRRDQHAALSNQALSLEIARSCVAGKVQNSRLVLQRAAREASSGEDAANLSETVSELGALLRDVGAADTLDTLRGREGEAAWRYFGVFGRMIRVDRASFTMRGRSRRPPRDRLNALLSFLYTLLANDCRAALEGVGLDPQVGYLHALRPGRPALALDLMEELRPVLADRLCLTLINRRQIRERDFVEFTGGAVYLSDEGRKKVIVAYQEKKREEVQHRVIEQKIPLGLVPHAQARLLARHLRGDLGHYPPFLA